MIVKPRGGRLCAVLVLCLFVNLCAGARVIEFDTAAQLENQFVAPAQGAYAWSAQPGAGGSAGRVDVLAAAGSSVTPLFSAFSFDLNQSAASASFLFQAAEGSGAVARVGLLLHTQRQVDNLAALSLKGLWLQDGEGRAPGRLVAGGGADVAQQAGLAGLVAGRWYGFRTVWELGADGASIEMGSQLWDYGADGSQKGDLLASASVRITDPALFGNGGVVSPLYLGVVAQNGKGGASAIDRISIEGHLIYTQVPEPSGAVLALGLGAIVAAILQRCRLRHLRG